MRLAMFIATLALLATVMTFHEAPVAQPQVAPTDIGGVVSSVNGAEAGVWVIAETNDLPTKFAKIVVTDDRGRYLIPQLPKARYAIWARGYGLVDSHKVQATPGTALNLQALVAPSAAAAGELPASKPTRPQGVERNVVLTMWDWAGPKDYLHDVVSTDKRDPRVNPHGLLFGATEESTDLFPVLDPVSHKASQVKMLVRDPATPSSKNAPMLPSPFWGEERIWDSQTSMHNPMLDEKGRVWFTSRVRPPANPDFCKKGSDHPSAKLFPVEQSNRHLSMYDPKTGKITLISTCFPTHHLVFAEDANNTLWTSAGGPQSGVVWTPLSSGHLASFDRRLCKGPLNGPTATGQHCPEGWTLYPFPGPQLRGVTESGSAEASYYTWVDQHDTFGLGRNVPMATGNANESLIALVNGAFVNLRVPYPMGFYARWMHGRIDDPNAGWKGMGLWSTYATRTPFHVEGGKGTTSKVVKFQLRPDPLAR